MKRIFTVLAIFTLCFNSISGQWWCNNNIIYLTSQQEVDDFAANYPGITTFDCISIYTNAPINNLNGLTQVTNVNETFDINGIDITDLTGLDNLTSVGRLSIGGNSNLLDLSGLSGLTSVNGLFINQNPVLNNISALSNLNYNDLQEVGIYGNSNLSACSLPILCSFFINPFNQTDTLSYLGGNAMGCDSIPELLDNCASLATINSEVFYDLNQNAVRDAGEPIYEGAALSINPSGITTFTNAPFYLNSGNYTISYLSPLTPDWTLTSSPSYTLNLNTGDIVDITFGLYPAQQVSEMQPLAVSPFTRCNDTITFDFSVKNMGTTTTDGTLWVTIDENVTSIDFINPPDQTIPPNLYGWNFTGLFPSQVYTEQVELGVPGPPDFSLGDLLYFDTYADFTDGNGTQTTSVHEYNPVVLCSFDPNDKLVHPDRTDIYEQNYTLFGEELIYTVRFQNTGNDVAYDVEIVDMLDANLDLSTFSVLNSSHLNKLVTTMDDNGLVAFTFNNIFLPDSTSNPVGSQGYVTYSIDHNPGLAENTIISNFAEIYFDANPPIVTNTTENVLVSELPTVSTTKPDLLDKVSIIPNPNSGLFEIKGITEGSYTIINTAGKLIQDGQLSQDMQIDISAMPAGVYFVSVILENKKLVKRLIMVN